ncbi:hypothetical protein [Pseudonocardia charpentierae]|uniref:Uncharacterized protein n=1 Tax=Pseudonocardia charpentierae TaxID=3075545 RepID=A0ABU2NEL4_9PSEU|nr:hypothetical protein [Pseudonocardia sp. DSM 45834]MDT0352186.1 hypothetical protein [Pseudonocardia sp. DSM 45834]
MPFSRRRRARSTTTLSGAVAHRLLDGSDDAPAPLRQLLAAATAPASEAELQGEDAARAAFRSAVHATPDPLRDSRRVRATTTTGILTAKIIAALALTATTAGGVALATNSYSAHLQSPVVSGSAGAGAQVSGVSPSGMTTSTSTPTPEGDDRSDSSASLGDDGEAAADGTVPSRAPAAPSRGPGGPCEARCTTNATESPVGPPGQPGQHSSPPSRAGSGDNSGNDDEPKKENADNGGPDNAKNPNSGNKPVKEKKEKSADNGKKPEKSNKSDGAKNPGKNDKVGGNGRSDPGSKQAGAEKGANKKKTDA